MIKVFALVADGVCVNIAEFDTDQIDDAGIADWIAADGREWLDVTGIEAGPGDAYDGAQPVGSQFVREPAIPIVLGAAKEISLREFRDVVGQAGLRWLRQLRKTDENVEIYWDYVAATLVMDRTDPDYGMIILAMEQAGVIDSQQALKAWPLDLRS